MSRRDRYHNIVKQALIRNGWQITHDPYIFETDPELSTDLGAERTIAAERENKKIAIEIKSFLRSSQVVDLERAIGQYELYKRLLHRQEPDRELYLAVPIYAYDGIFSREIGKIAIEEFALKLIIFSLTETEELIWKTS